MLLSAKWKEILIELSAGRSFSIMITVRLLAVSSEEFEELSDIVVTKFPFPGFFKYLKL